MVDDPQSTSAKNNDNNSNKDFPNKFIVPVMFCIGIIGGWIWCGIWHGIYFHG